MFKKVLIANRGEISLRIIRACKELDIETVAIYSTEDKDSLHVKMADEAYCVGNAKSQDSYLNIPSIVSIAVQTSCDAVHPGYGFLAENPEFVSVLDDLDIKFIGPRADTMDLMGDKAAAKETALRAGVPVVPGSDGIVESVDQAKEIADSIGYPILVKASYGGGGKGMRRVDSKEDLHDAFQAAKTEAQTAFGNGDLYLEKLILNPKHIEFQIISDQYANVIHLGERHCSIQRKNQKLIEEAPYRKLGQELRLEMGQASKNLAKECNYEGVGTVEYILDEDMNYYFIEMNTRVQVEHPVSEMVTGVDIIKEQIRVAAGLSLSYDQEDISINGHAIEVRVNAENPSKSFMPSTGRVEYIFIPGGMDTRFDTYLYTGAKVSPYYDSMLGKIIVRGANRLDAIKKMRRAIEETIIDGVKTNLGYQYSILHIRDFVRDDYDTGFIEKNHEKIMQWIDEVESAEGK